MVFYENYITCAKYLCEFDPKWGKINDNLIEMNIIVCNANFIPYSESCWLGDFSGYKFLYIYDKVLFSFTVGLNLVVGQCETMFLYNFLRNCKTDFSFRKLPRYWIQSIFSFTPNLILFLCWQVFLNTFSTGWFYPSDCFPDSNV